MGDTSGDPHDARKDHHNGAGLERFRMGDCRGREEKEVAMATVTSLSFVALVWACGFGTGWIFRLIENEWRKGGKE